MVQEPAAQGPRARRASIARAAALAAAVAATALLLACAHREPPAPKPAATAATAVVADVRDLNRTLTPEEAREYVGDAACASCHPAISHSHAATGHAATLRTVTVREHGERFRLGQRVTDPTTGVAYSVGVRDGACAQFATENGGTEVAPATLAVGSGASGQTYLARVGPGRWIDLRLSYYARLRRWEFTPIQAPGEHADAPAAGLPMDTQRLANCLACHTTYMVEGGDGPDLSRSHLGVGCERCHGPGRRHAESARVPGALSRGTLVHMEDLHRATPARLMQICGACHGTEGDPRVGVDPRTESGLPRFQTTALERSKCFASGRLTCSTCHDPHSGVSHDTMRYDRACLGCHGGSARGAAQTSAQVVCKVNPRTGCIACHMPAQHVPTIPHSVYHNHWIKVWRSG